jgi:hypothetical protein
VALDNNSDLASWSGTPYLWFAFHWLAMSHSCYNPVIYCWMNARFRVGFCNALDHVPCLRRLLPHTTRHRRSNTSSVTGVALTGNVAHKNVRLVQCLTVQISDVLKYKDYMPSKVARVTKSERYDLSVSLNCLLAVILFVKISVILWDGEFQRLYTHARTHARMRTGYWNFDCLY